MHLTVTQGVWFYFCCFSVSQNQVGLRAQFLSTWEAEKIFKNVNSSLLESVKYILEKSVSAS